MSNALWTWNGGSNQQNIVNQLGLPSVIVAWETQNWMTAQWVASIIEWDNGDVLGDGKAVISKPNYLDFSIGSLAAETQQVRAEGSHQINSILDWQQH